MSFQRDHDKFNDWFWATKDKLYSFLLKHTGNAQLTQDIMQDCYYKLWLHREGVDPERVENLLFTYARHAFIDHLRKKSTSAMRFRKIEDHESIDTNSPEKQLMAAELNERITSRINMLPPKRKKVFTLIREHGLSYKEVGARLGISTATIRRHMNEALKFLHLTDIRDV